MSLRSSANPRPIFGRIGTGPPRRRICGVAARRQYPVYTAGRCRDMVLDWSRITALYPRLFLPGTTFHHIIMIGAAQTNTQNGGPAFTPSDAKAIDGKMDDGKPTTGLVITNGQPPTCVNGSDLATMDYAASSENVACALVLDAGV